ncbi:MAG: flagellar export chaperone FlgN [Planctomycetes bacterium]|nr:flagellar export chaperone FlgN [Planctomycetota bacterium]
MNPDHCARELARLLTEQAEVCEHILEKSRQQQRKVEESREDELLSLLSEKQMLIARHQSLSEEAGPFRREWEDGARARADAATHAAVEAAWNRLRDILDAIVKLEDASRAFLQEQKEKVTVEIGNLHKGKLINKAYGGGPRVPPSARYSDKEG